MVSRSSVVDRGNPIVGFQKRNIGRGHIERTKAENTRRKIRRSSREMKKKEDEFSPGTCSASIHHKLTTGVAQAATTPSSRV